MPEREIANSGNFGGYQMYSRRLLRVHDDNFLVINLNSVKSKIKRHIQRLHFKEEKSILEHILQALREK